MKFFKHQTEAHELAMLKNLALFHDCGTGKTFTGLNIIKYHKAQGYGPALVTCPLSIIEDAWFADCQKFTPELSIVSLWDKNPAKRKERLAESHDIYVANYETLKYLYDDICNKQFDMLFVDESSKMKNPKSQITRALLSFAGIHFRGSKFKTHNTIPLRYCLSGTPAPNNESEYWAQIKLIAGQGNNGFNDNFYAFRNKYFYSIPLGMTGQKIFKFRESMRQEFMDAMKPYCHIVRKEDALDLPEQIHEIRKVYLSREEQKAYDTLKRELVLEFKDESILAKTALVEVMKLRQLTSGFAYGNNGIHQTGKSKFNELKDLLDEIGNHQVIIWCNFRYEISILFKELTNSDALWSGSIDRDKTIRDFKAGRIKYLIANPQSAAHGLTFTNCRYAVYFSMNHSYELQKQSQDRIHRIGQNQKTTYYYLIADKTVDEPIFKAVQNKASLSNATLNYLKGVNVHGKESRRVAVTV